MKHNEYSGTATSDRVYHITIDPTTQLTKPNSEIGKIRNNIKCKTGITINQFSSMVSYPYSYTWFGGTLNGLISNENWSDQSVYGLDFDKGSVSIEEVLDRLHRYEILPQVWYYSLSDSEKLRKFRVVFFLDRPVTTKEEHELITTGLLKLFPEADPKCKNAGRFFFGGKQSYIINTEPNNKNKLCTILATIIISRDGGKTRNIPSGLTQHRDEVNPAPNQHLLYNIYRSCHFSPNPDNIKSTSHSGAPNKFLIDLDEARRKVKILDMFLSGTWLYHNELFGLATNLQYIRGGQKLMIETMKKYNDQGITNYTDNNFNIFPYLKKVNYYPQLIKNFSPYPEDSDLYDIITATKEIRGKIESIDEIRKIPLSEAENRFNTEFDRVIKEGEIGKIYVFKLPTAIGKTQTITSCTGVTIAAPTNDLKNEISSRMNVVHHSTPDGIEFESDYLNNLIHYYYSIGLPRKSTAVIHDVVNKTGTVKYSESDIRKSEQYLSLLKKSYMTNDTILTTHSRALFSDFNHSTVIIDEDPLNSLISIKSLEISDLVKLNNNLFEENPSLQTTINFFNSLIPGEIKKTPVLSVDLDGIIDQISRSKINSDIISFFESSYLMKDPMTPNIIHYVVKKELPSSKKIIILSATIPVYIYKKLYGDRLQVVDISDVEHTGEIIQYTKRSCSRNGLSHYHKEISECVGNTPVITFKSFQNQFKNPVKEMYFGNCSGYDTLKGKDIAVVGTPNRDNIQYLLTASILGIDFKTTDTTMTYQKIDYNGFRFKIKCYDHPDLRQIQFSFIESDLVQAVGRARTLRTKSKVHLYSNFPLRLSTEFVF